MNYNIGHTSGKQEPRICVLTLIFKQYACSKAICVPHQTQHHGITQHPVEGNCIRKRIRKQKWFQACLNSFRIFLCV